MKFRVIFLKKKNILYFLILVLVLLIFLVFFFRNTTTTFNVTEKNSIKADLNGDGHDDILNVKNDNNKYYIEINTKSKTYTLDPDKDIKTLGIYSSTWPMKINMVDISRDRIPEIFIQSSYKDNPLQHIFHWNGEKFENIFSNSNSILGFIDYNNNKTPKIVSGAIVNNKINLNNYIFSNYKFTSYNYDCKDTFMGKDSVLYFINFIQGLPNNEAYRPNDIFAPNISGKSLSTIGTLSGENNKYIFQDALFMDTKCDKDGEASEVKWVLNFKGISNANKYVAKNYTITLFLKPVNDSSASCYFKIYSINIS